MRLKLARSYRSGDLTPVWVPDAEHEALRDLVRGREVAKKDQLRARQRLGKFLLRRGLRAVGGMKSWTKKHLLWVKTLRFERPAQEAVWAYQYRPAMSPEMKKRQEGLSEEVKEIAWKAQHRLCTRYRRLVAKGKLRSKVTTAIGRELLGFIWAIGTQIEKEQRLARTSARAA